jgi:hypothetical protein
MKKLIMEIEFKQSIEEDEKLLELLAICIGGINAFFITHMDTLFIKRQISEDVEDTILKLKIED